MDYSQFNMDAESMDHECRLSGIYFISNCAGAVKIGQTTRIGKRLEELQTNSATRLVIIQFIKCNKEDLNDVERMYHRMFRHCKIRNEWFSEVPVMDYLMATHKFMYTSDVQYKLIHGENPEYDNDYFKEAI